MITVAIIIRTKNINHGANVSFRCNTEKLHTGKDDDTSIMNIITDECLVPSLSTAHVQKVYLDF